jgi:hypothetical protein
VTFRDVPEQIEVLNHRRGNLTAKDTKDTKKKFSGLSDSWYEHRDKQENNTEQEISQRRCGTPRAAKNPLQ